MSITVLIEFQAQPGGRDQLKGVLESISATHGPTAAGFLGSTVHETLDSGDGLVEIAEWATAEDQADAVRAATAAGIYAPVLDLVAAPFRVTRLS